MPHAPQQFEVRHGEIQQKPAILRKQDEFHSPLCFPGSQASKLLFSTGKLSEVKPGRLGKALAKAPTQMHVA